MNARTPDLTPDLRWMLQRVPIAELGGLDTALPTREARQAVTAARGAPTDEEFRALLDSERGRLGLLELTPGEGWPTPIAQALSLLVEKPVEGNWDRLHSRMRDAFEVLVQFLASIAISDLMQRAEVPPAFRGMLVNSLEVPKLGNWVGFLRAAVATLAADSRPPFVPELVAYHGAVHLRIDEFVAMRNQFIHGGTPEQETCLADFADKLPKLARLLHGADFLKRYLLVGFDEKGPVHGRGPAPATAPPEEQQLPEETPDGLVFLQKPDGGESLCLSPLLVYRFCQYRLDRSRQCGGPQRTQLFLFYNSLDRKKKKVTLLDTFCRHLARDADPYSDFIERFRLDEWRRADTERFETLIEEKTQNFVGRRDEVAQVNEWMNSNASGFCLIRGDPGVGKSALVSALSRIGAETDFDDPALTSLLRADAWPGVDVIPYFIVRGSRTARPTEFLTTVLQRLGRCYDLRCASSGSADELDRELEQQLRVVGGLLRQRGRKLLLLIDGLDEAVGAEGETSAGESLLRHVPRDVPLGVFVVLAGRRRKEVEALRALLHREKVFALELLGLSTSDVRSLLQQVVSKYELGADYVDEVTRRSGGNPLYVKLLMEALLEGHLRLNDAGSLPEDLRAMYRTIVDRIIGETPAALPLLMTLALAREQLTTDQLGGMTGQSLPEAVRAINVCLEVLTDRVGIDGRAIYRVFHDSFGDFLRQHPNFAGLTTETSQRMLCFLARENPLRAAEAGLLAVVERLFAGSELRAADAPALSRLIEQSSRTLTGYHLLLQNLTQRPPDQVRALLTALARLSGAATARMTIQCLVAVAEKEPVSVGRALVELVEKQVRGKSQSVAQANLQAARVALEASVGASHVPGLREDVCRVLLGGCSSADANVRTLGVVALFRLTHANHDLGIDVLRRLAQKTLWLGLIRPRKLETFAACALALFFERSQDEKVRRDLKPIIQGLIARTWGLRFALWFLPTIGATLWETLPDYNPCTPVEFKAYKQYARKHPELAEAAAQTLAFLDPAHGTAEAFRQSIHRLAGQLLPGEASIGQLSASMSLVSRILAGEESALSLSYDLAESVRGNELTWQDVLYRLRLVQVGRKLKKQVPLDDAWTDRGEAVMREFFYERHGVFRGNNRSYVLCSMVPGMAFLINQRGHGRLPILKEFIDFACMAERGVFAWADAPPDRKAIVILARLLEVVGVEYGLTDPLAREAAYFGISCFLEHAGTLDDRTWERLAAILVRMKVYEPTEVEQFLESLPAERRDKLQVLANRILPHENVGLILSQPCADRFMASVLGEPPGMKHGLREQWRLFIGELVSTRSLTATYRAGASQVFNLLRGLK